MPEDRAASFLQLIRKSQRGRLKIYLGYGPGVGKTYQMLIEAHRLQADGIDVVVGMVETHGRAETEKQLAGLPVIPRRKVEYHGIVVEEMDLDAVLARKPQVVLVDELAHTNAPDSRNPKRYQDVQEILAAGIHVISALNVQHLESLYNTVEKLLNVKVRERLPDSVLAEADVVVNVDLAAEDLQRRLEEGNVYPKERVASALQNFFTASNLEHLRELTMRELASQLDFKRREVKSASPQSNGADQLMVCLSSRGPNSAKLLRYGSRLAGRLNRNWYALYVQTPSEDPTTIDAKTQRLLGDTLTLAAELGATVFQYKGTDVADTILRFAREYRVGNIVIGRPRPVPMWKKLKGERSVASSLIEKSEGVTVIVVDVDTPESGAADAPPEVAGKVPASSGGQTKIANTMGGLLTADHILIWEDAVKKEDIFQTMVKAITGGELSSAESILKKLNERESTGSTFLNEGVALPHARLEELESPKIALGLTHGGVLDVATDKSIEAVFMLLSPMADAGTHLQMLARAGRMLQNREVRRRLAKVKSAAAALEEIRDWEQADPAFKKTGPAVAGAPGR